MKEGGKARLTVEGVLYQPISSQGGVVSRPGIATSEITTRERGKQDPTWTGGIPVPKTVADLSRRRYSS